MSARLLLLSRVAALAGALLLAGCAGVGGERGVRPTVYDFGPGTAQAAAPQVLSGQAPLVLANVETSTALDGNAVLYRLAYADAQQLRPYALARWSTTPAQLLQQRLREHLGAQRVVLVPGDSVAAAARSGGEPGPRALRITLEEFSQVFESPARSSGLLRLRATLLQSTPAGERLLAQRGFVVQQPAPSADAPGGVRALTAAADAAAQQLADWLAQQP